MDYLRREARGAWVWYKIITGNAQSPAPVLKRFRDRVDTDNARMERERAEQEEKRTKARQQELERLPYTDASNSPIDPKTFKKTPDVNTIQNEPTANSTPAIAPPVQNSQRENNVLTLIRPNPSVDSDKVSINSQTTISQPSSEQPKTNATVVNPSATVQSTLVASEPLFHTQIRELGSGYIVALRALLAEKKIDLKTTGEQGQTCLHIAMDLAVDSKKIDELNPIELTRFLLQREPTLINIQDAQGNTPAHRVLQHNILNLDLCTLLIKHKSIQHNILNKDQKMLLHLAIERSTKKNYEEIALLLIEQNVDLEIRNAYGQTPLHLAILHKNKNIAARLIEQKANVNAPDKEGNKPIHYAAAGAQPDIIELLKSNAADIAATNDMQENALHYAIKQWNSNWTAKKYSKFDRLTFWNTTEQQEILEQTVTKLLQFSKKGLLHARDQLDWTPLHWACYIADPEQLDKSYMITLLINRGADLKVTTKEGNTPFMTALLFGMPIQMPNTDNPEKSIELAKLLLPHDKQEKSKLVQLANQEGNTALHFAVIANTKYADQTIKYLLDKGGADPFIKNHKGYSAYDLVSTLLAKSNLFKLEEKCLTNIQKQFENHSKYNFAMQIRMVDELPKFTLPQALKGYQLPWHQLPESEQEEKTPTQAQYKSSIKEDQEGWDFLNKPQELSSNEKSPSIAGTDASSTSSSAWTDIKPAEDDQQVYELPTDPASTFRR